MKSGKMVVLWAALGIWATPGLAGGFDEFQGSWKGPWYIGMSSGKVVMDLRVDGEGTIAMTQLDGFGDAPVPLKKFAVDGNVIRFSAAGENGIELSVKASLGADGRRLLGNGKYGGFGARLELQRSP